MSPKELPHPGTFGREVDRLAGEGVEQVLQRPPMHDPVASGVQGRGVQGEGVGGIEQRVADDFRISPPVGIRSRVLSGVPPTLSAW